MSILEETKQNTMQKILFTKGAIEYMLSVLGLSIDKEGYVEGDFIISDPSAAYISADDIGAITQDKETGKPVLYSQAEFIEFDEDKGKTQKDMFSKKPKYEVLQEGRPATAKEFGIDAEGWDNNVFDTLEEAQKYLYQWAFPINQDHAVKMAENHPIKVGEQYEMGTFGNAMMSIREI